MHHTYILKKDNFRAIINNGALICAKKKCWIIVATSEGVLSKRDKKKHKGNVFMLNVSCAKKTRKKMWAGETQTRDF